VQNFDAVSNVTAPPPSGVRDIQGTLIDRRYRVDEPLGNGTMGVVFAAYDIALQRRVAIKVLNGAPSIGASVDRFHMEARALAQIRHENVVQVYSFGHYEGLPYMAMEFVDGRSLESMIEEHGEQHGTVPRDIAVSIIRRVGAGLAAVHERLLVHRDVKPSNIVVEKRTGRPVLIDFGLAHSMSRTSKASVIAGTPCYMAPEQARDTSLVSGRSDVYALACTAFELLTGRLVFDTEDMVAMFIAHAETPPPRISSILPAFEPLDPVFLRALAKDPRDRYGACEDFIAEFDEAVRRLPSAPGAKRSILPTLPAPAPYVPVAPVLRILVLKRDGALRRELIRSVESTLRAAGDEIEIESVDSSQQFVQAFARRRADIIVIDDDDALQRAGCLVDGVRATALGSFAEIAVISTSSSSELASRCVREVPKPVNTHVLRAVIAKMSHRIAERRLRELWREDETVEPSGPVASYTAAVRVFSTAFAERR
jgi:serine/threonine-protein kinase